MRIALASKGNPRDVKTWSGIPKHIVDVLEGRGHEVFTIDLEKPVEPWYYDWYRRFYYWLGKKWFLADVEPKMLQKIGNQFDKDVLLYKPDVVLVIHGDFLAYTSFSIPSIIIHDTTFASLLNYYSAFSNLTDRSIKNGNRMYERALNKAKSAVFSARWAADSAIKDYNASSNKINVLPFGPNIEEIPDRVKVESWIQHRRNSDHMNFLFLGVDWIRKGGPDALHFVKELNRQGVKAQLIVVGCNAQINDGDRQYIIEKGFLRKSIPDENKQLEQLFINAHALLLPSIAECYGCVYCEANAYGLPALGRDTGGVSEIIKEGHNGLLLFKNDTIEEYVHRWLSLWMRGDSYVNMSMNARNEYETRLNYQVFAQNLEELMIDAVKKRDTKLT